jgi:hypothetical protein
MSSIVAEPACCDVYHHEIAAIASYPSGAWQVLSGLPVVELDTTLKRNLAADLL